MVERIIPILAVGDLDVSFAYYTRVLGFALDWRSGGIASLSRDGHAIMLCAGPQGSPGMWLWIGVTDAEPLFEQFTSRCANIDAPPKNFSFAYEFRVRDPDGHILRFGSESKSDRPFDTENW